jgi:hypothetical protein
VAWGIVQVRGVMPGSGKFEIREPAAADSDVLPKLEATRHREDLCYSLAWATGSPGHPPNRRQS